ncbi:MAG: helix-turn-helix domain-containing protein [Myxococcales bacterium]|nr:helix-turn-helix domain-containing protein [Myxococcales bacterium]
MLADTTVFDGFVPREPGVEPHRVGIIAMDGFVPFDLATAADSLSWVQRPDGSPPYEVWVCGVRAAPELVRTGLMSVAAPRSLRALSQVHTVVAPGVSDVDAEVPPCVIAALRASAARGARVMSICTGAFVLAAAGLLDGLRATTHWAAAELLQQRFPRVRVDPTVLYVDEGSVLTSAGAAAGLDLCLHVIRRDLGACIAADAARRAVTPLERAGGQAQFIAAVPPRDVGSLAPLLDRVRSELHEDWSTARMARAAAMSLRTLNRRFREQVGTTPARWLTRMRIHRAQQLLESTSLSMEAIAEAVGFGSATTLRERFRAQLGTSPSRYRSTFRSSAA